jgi:hypothetical protein
VCQGRSCLTAPPTSGSGKWLGLDTDSLLA